MEIPKNEKWNQISCFLLAPPFPNPVPAQVVRVLWNYSFDQWVLFHLLWTKPHHHHHHLYLSLQRERESTVLIDFKLRDILVHNQPIRYGLEYCNKSITNNLQGWRILLVHVNITASFQLIWWDFLSTLLNLPPTKGFSYTTKVLKYLEGVFHIRPLHPCLTEGQGM